MKKLKTLPDTAALEAAIAESSERPVVIFKHSRTCGISCEAFDELHAHLAGAPVEASYNLISPEKGDTLDIVGWVTIDNQTGKQFDDAVVKLIGASAMRVVPSRLKRACRFMWTNR